MRLSTVFELLLICLLIAFAAYGHVIGRDELHHRLIRAAQSQDKQSNLGISIMSLKQAEENVNRYCTCSKDVCNCCRDFHIPIVSLQGPGCASLQYRGEGNLAVQLSFGNSILTSAIINGRKPKPICVRMPGGFSNFCGRIYSIQREADDHFKACLGLELQSASELEASLRVSCFRFGPDGLKLRPAEDYPLEDLVGKPSDEEENDEDDLFGLGDDDDDDDDDDDEDDDTPSKNTQNQGSLATGNQTEDSDNDDDDDDLLGFGTLLDILTGDDDEDSKKKPTTAAPILPFTIPLINRPTTTRTPPPAVESNSISSTVKPSRLETVTSSSTTVADVVSVNNTEDVIQSLKENITAVPEVNLDIVPEVTETILDSSTPTVESNPTVASESNDVKVAEILKKPLDVKKIIVGVKNKKTSATSTSINAITSDIKKPYTTSTTTTPKPALIAEDNDDDFLEALADDEEDDDEKKAENEHEDDEEENEDHQDDEFLEDDDEDEEDAVLTALIDDTKDKNKVKKVSIKSKKNVTLVESNDADYEESLADAILDRSLRNRTARRGRQSKDMKF